METTPDYSLNFTPLDIERAQVMLSEFPPTNCFLLAKWAHETESFLLQSVIMDWREYVLDNKSSKYIDSQQFLHKAMKANNLPTSK